MASAKSEKKGKNMPYEYMIEQALKAFKGRGSKRAILAYILDNFPVKATKSRANSFLKMALQRGLDKGWLIKVTGGGMKGSFLLTKWFVADLDIGKLKMTIKKYAAYPKAKSEKRRSAIHRNLADDVDLSGDMLYGLDPKVCTVRNWNSDSDDEESYRHTGHLLLD